MKKSDIAMIVLIVSVSVLAAFFAANSILGNKYNGNTKVKTIDRIDSSIVEPSPDIFNKNAINPAVQVQIDSVSGSTLVTPGVQ